MSFSALYEHCQDLAVPIGTRSLRDKVCELTRRAEPIKVMASERMLDGVIWGFILWPENPRHPYAQFCNGQPIIIFARGISDLEQRFVIVKELMHLFDEALERVSTPKEFEGLLSDMSVTPPAKPTAAMQSEARCIWMALIILCPETLRQDIQRKRELGEINDEQVSQQLRIPTIYVPMLFVPNFKDIVALVLANC